jgi:hypothetical protein
VTIAIGAFLNAIGILLGGLFGLARRQPLSAPAQYFFRNALGAFTVFFGLRLVWVSVHGSFLSVLKQIFIAFLAVLLGFWLGKLLHLQKISNRLGRSAGNAIAFAQKTPPGGAADGFAAGAVLFCAAPLGLIGAVTDGLSGYFYLLAVKAVMDGLATVSFVKMFRWPAALAAIPVFIFLSAITAACHFFAAPFLDAHHLTGAVNAAAGLVACAVALVIFETRKVELANYLPGLVLAPLLAWLLN